MINISFSLIPFWPKRNTHTVFIATSTFKGTPSNNMFILLCYGYK